MKTRIFNISLVPGVDTENYIKIINDAQIIIDDNIIIYAGASLTAPNFDVDKQIDGNNSLAMPGMVNLHTHNPMTLLRSVGGNYALEEWLTKAIFPREKNLTDIAVAAGSKLGIMEMLRYGTTNFCDMYMFMDAQAKVVRECGIRATLGHGTSDFDNTFRDFYTGLEFAENWNNKANGRIKTCLAPHSTYLTTTKLLKLTAKYAKDLNLPIHTHISETLEENKIVFEKFGTTPSRVLLDTGILENPVIAAHCVWLSDDDFDLISKYNFTVAHNPISNLKLASGIANTSKMLEYNINIGLGTDGVASNNNLNLWEEMRTYPLLQKAKHLDPTLITPAQALKAATLNGARALGYTNLGLLKEGYLADIILVDTNTTVSCPANDIENDIIYAIQGSDVVLTMVDGNILYHNGKFTYINDQEALNDARLAAKLLNN